MEGRALVTQVMDGERSQQHGCTSGSDIEIQASKEPLSSPQLLAYVPPTSLCPVTKGLMPVTAGSLQGLLPGILLVGLHHFHMGCSVLELPPSLDEWGCAANSLEQSEAKE